MSLLLLSAIEEYLSEHHPGYQMIKWDNTAYIYSRTSDETDNIITIYTKSQVISTRQKPHEEYTERDIMHKISQAIKQICNS